MLERKHHQPICCILDHSIPTVLHTVLTQRYVAATGIMQRATLDWLKRKNFVADLNNPVGEPE